jgi:hypothetical protein
MREVESSPRDLERRRACVVPEAVHDAPLEKRRPRVGKDALELQAQAVLLLLPLRIGARELLHALAADVIDHAALVPRLRGMGVRL